MPDWSYPEAVRGWLTEGEARALADLAAGKRVLEVGTYAGLSACSMAQTAVAVVAVDPHDHGQGDTAAEAAANLGRYARGNWRLVRDRIQSAAADLDGPYDGLFLDASHSEEETIEEFRACERLLKPDAWVALHDWGPPPPRPGWYHWPGVKAAAERLFDGPPAVTVDTLAVFNRAQARTPRERVFNVVTPLSRPEIVPVLEAYFAGLTTPWEVRWWVAVDAVQAPDVKSVRGATTILGQSGGSGNPHRNACLDRIDRGWVYFLDDDNLPGDGFFAALWQAAAEHPDAVGFLVDQAGRLDGAATMRGAPVDTAMFVFLRGAISDTRWDASAYVADQWFFRAVFEPHRDRVVHIPRPLARYNALRERCDELRWEAVIAADARDAAPAIARTWNGGGRHALRNPDLFVERPRAGVVVGALAALPYVHLQLEARRRYYPGVPLLVHGNGPRGEGELADLCRAYGCDFERTDERSHGSVGDLTAFLGGLLWARYRGLDVLVKVSSRWVFLGEWADGLADLALASQYATFGSHTSSYGYGFRTECLGLAVAAWGGRGFVNKVTNAIRRGDPVFVEGYMHRCALAREEANSFAAERWRLRDRPPAGRAGYAQWPLLGTDRCERSAAFLWHDACGPEDYHATARAWGLPYTPDDFIRAGRGAGVSE